MAVYSNTFESPFIFDDAQNILNNPHIRLTNWDRRAIVRAAFDCPLTKRPVANLSFALNYYVHQYHLKGYHLANILIHAASGIFLYLLVKTMLRTPALRNRCMPAQWIPFFTALVWLVHPLQTQSVTYIVQRMNSLAAMFYVSSLLLYARGRLVDEPRKKWSLYAGCVLAGILAMGTKEVAATLPFYILLYEWYFHQDLSIRWLKRHIVPLAGVMFVFAVAALIYLDGQPLEKIFNSYGSRDFTIIQRLLTQFRVVVFYISLLIWPYPSRLNLDHDFPVSNSVFDPVTTILTMGMIAGLLGLAIYLARRQRLISFCILWFLGNLVIESSVIGLEIIFEHRTYLPSMLVILMAVASAHRYIQPRWLGFRMICALVIVFSAWTYARNGSWSNEIAFWKDCVAKSPNKSRPYISLGFACDKQGMRQEAVECYQQALRIKPGDTEVRRNFEIALQRMGKFSDAAKNEASP